MTAAGPVASCDLLLAARSDRDSCPQGHRGLEVLADEGHRHSALADGRADAFGRAGAHVPGREDAGHARLEPGGGTVERPVRRFRVHVCSGHDEALGIALNRVRQPFRVRLRADEDEERRGGTRLPKPPFPVGDREPLKLAVAVAFDGFRRRRTSTFGRVRISRTR